jgi:hypothetical protein
MTRLRKIGCVVAAVAALGPVSAAEAAQRYASPTGAGGASCAPDDPCSLTTAITGASDNDEVIVASGAYSTSAPIATSNDISVHGVPGQPRPVLSTSGYLFLGSEQSSLSDFEIDSTVGGTTALEVAGQTVDRVVSKATPTSGGVAACRFTGANAVIRDTVCWGQATGGAEADGLSTGDAASDSETTLRNVTAIGASGAGWGVYAGAHGGAVHKVTVINSIVRGAPSDFFVAVDGGASSVVGTTTHTNYETVAHAGGVTAQVTDDDTKQTAAPVFVDAANGDLHEQAGSPTVDAGLNSAENGPTDADGTARTVHGTTDIGGFELHLSPSANTEAPSAIRPFAVTAHGTVNPNRAATSYRFEFGDSPDIVRSTPWVPIGAGGAPQAVEAELLGLRPSTGYLVRVVAKSELGTTGAEVVEFHTSADPFRGLRIPKQTARVSHGKARVRVRCPASTFGTCQGKLKLTAKKPSGLHGARRLTLGSRKFTLLSGQARKLKVELSSRALDLLDVLGKLKAKGRATAHDRYNTRRKTSGKVTLKLKR